MKYTKEIGLSVGVLTCAILGARFDYQPLLYALIGLVLLSFVLACFGKLSEKMYPYLIYSIGLSLIYQTSLLGPGLVGTDIHKEYYYMQLTVSNGWSSLVSNLYNFCISIVFIGPLLQKLGIPGYWVFKAVFPTFFAFTPVLLYYLFKKYTSHLISYLSAVFFVLVPTYLSQIPGMARQMMAEPLCVLGLFILITTNWRAWLRVLLATAILALGFASHYTTGDVFLIGLGTFTVVITLFKRDKSVIPYWITCGIFLAVGLIYYAIVMSGIWLTTYIPKLLFVHIPLEPLAKTAIGLDFASASASGKAYRILQCLTELFMVIGFFKVLFGKYAKELKALTLAGCPIVLMFLVIPHSVSLERSYFYGLVFLFPVIIIGGLTLLRKPALLCIPLVLYLVFTSGAVFEATQQTDRSSIQIPFTIALSHQRVNFGIATKNDLKVLSYIKENHPVPVYVDLSGDFIMDEIYSTSVWNKDYLWIYPLGPFENPPELFPISVGSYVFLTERTAESKTFVFQQYTAGLRTYFSFQEAEFDLNNYRAVYQAGDAVLLRRIK